MPASRQAPHGSSYDACAPESPSRIGLDSTVLQTVSVTRRFGLIESDRWGSHPPDLAWQASASLVGFGRRSIGSWQFLETAVSRGRREEAPHGSLTPTNRSERPARIERASSAWKAVVLPLNYGRELEPPDGVEPSRAAYKAALPPRSKGLGAGCECRARFGTLTEGHAFRRKPA